MKVKELFAKLLVQLSGDKPDMEGATATLKLLGPAYEEETKGFGDTKAFGEAIAAVNKRLDEQSELLRSYQKQTLIQRYSSVPNIGLNERRQLLANRIAFSSDDQAKRFGAYMGYRLLSRIDDVAARVCKTLHDDVCKIGDLEPSAGAAAIIPEEFRNELIRNVEVTGVVFTKMRQIPLGLGQMNIPVRSGGITAYPLAVLASFIKTAPAATNVSMTAVKWGTLTGVPNELFRAPSLLVQVGQWIGTEISYAIAHAFDNAVVNGDGTAAYGGITGILQDATIPTSTPVADHDTMTEITGQDISAVIGDLAAGYALGRAGWGMSLSVLGFLRGLRTSTDENAQPIFRSAEQASPPTIDGYQYTVSDVMPAKSTITTDAKYAFFGDLAMSHLFGMMGSLEIATDQSVYFESDATAIRGLVAVDCEVADANALVVAKTHS
jgi:HK97 family phage major capsid protein